LLLVFRHSAIMCPRFRQLKKMIFFSSFSCQHLLLLNLTLLYILLTFFTRRERSSSSSSSSSSLSEMVGVDLKAIIFFFWGAISSLAFLSISWVLRLQIRPMSSISSLSLSSFNVVALTSHCWPKGYNPRFCVLMITKHMKLLGTNQVQECISGFKKI